MAEVRKNKNISKYNIKDIKKSNNEDKSNIKNVEGKKKNEKNKSLSFKIKSFIYGIKEEFKKVHWTEKKDLIKYSIATVVFVIFLSVFFYIINILFAFIQSLLK